MSRLTQYFGWRDVLPEHLTPLWKQHNLSHLEVDSEDVKRLRKTHLKSTLIARGKGLSRKKKKEENNVIANTPPPNNSGTQESFFK